MHKTLKENSSASEYKTADNSVSNFAGRGVDYYSRTFEYIHNSTSAIPFTFNTAAAFFGPLWAASRGSWGLFWAALVLELIAWVQIGRGLWSDLGATAASTAQRQLERAADFLAKAETARTAGESGERFETLAKNMTIAGERSQAAADAAIASAPMILAVGITLLVTIKLLQGVFSNLVYEKQYENWRVDPARTESGFKAHNVILGAVLVCTIMPMTLLNYTLPGMYPILEHYPANPDHYGTTASFIDTQIDAAAKAGSGFFDSIVAAVHGVLNALTIALIGTPWPVVMTIIAAVAYRTSGPRVAIFTCAAMAYLAIFGFWEVSMETIALVGAAVFVCVFFGIPLGILFGKSERSHKLAEPVLDLMQTLPAFVYLIPIIAFFGTGNPPGVLATIIFGMPPVIRLTALGIKGVPQTIKESALAFGATRWQLLKDVEFPLAKPSIMAGVNQTILMCLSMVVIISLIGGGGLGKTILEALQYAAKGPGILGGLAILVCAIVIDRIVQGAFKK